MIKRYITERTIEFNEFGQIVRETVTNTEEHDDNFYGSMPMFNPYWMNPGITGFPVGMLPSSVCECDCCDECECEVEIENEVEYEW